MNEVKQVIVVRKDLNMRKGKIAAQEKRLNDLPEMRDVNYRVDKNGNVQIWYCGRKLEPEDFVGILGIIGLMGHLQKLLFGVIQKKNYQSSILKHLEEVFLLL